MLAKSKERKIGVVLQYIQLALNVAIQLLYTPIMLRILGSNEYGIYSVASSVIAYLNLLSLGFGASYLRFYSKYKKSNDEKGIENLNGLYLIVFSFIGIISLFFGLLLSENANAFFNNTYSSNDLNIAKILMIFLSINMAFSFPSSVFVSYVTSQEKFVFQKLLNMGKTIFSPVASMIVLLLGYGSVGMVVCMTAVSIFIDVINILFCFLILKMRISISKLDLFLLKDIFVFSIFIAINQIIDQINWQTDKIILGKIVNGTAVAIYTIGASINTMFISFSTAISSVFSPKINMIVSKHDETMDEELTELFIKVGRIQWFLVTIIFSGFVFFGRFFIYKWAGSGYEKSYWVALILMAPMIVPGCQTLGIEIQRAKNKHQIRSIVYLFIAILNVLISIFLALFYGEIGCAIGTFISIVVGPCVFMNIYYHKVLKINVLMFWKSICSTLPSFLLPFLLGLSLAIFHSFTTIIDFLFWILIYVVVFAISIYFFGLESDEKQAIKGILKKHHS